MLQNIRKTYFIEFVISLQFFSAVLIPFFTEWGGMTFKTALILQSWFIFWIFVFEIPTGTVADYLGRKHSLVLAALSWVVGCLVYGSYPSIYIFMTGELFFALSCALSTGAKEALVYDSLKKARKTKDSKKVFSNAQVFHLLGILVGALIGGIIAAVFGVRWTMLLSAAPAFFAFLVALTLKEPRFKQEKQSYVEIMISGVNFFRKHRELKILAFDMVSIAVASYFIIWIYQMVLLESGINKSVFGVVHALLVVAQILVMKNFSRIEAVTGKKGLLLLSAVAVGLFFIIAAFIRNYAVIPLIVVAAGFGLSRKPLFSAYMNKFIPSQQRATVISTTSMVQRFVQALVNPVVGFLADWSLMYAMVIIGVVTLVLAFASRVEERHLED